jgi:hypothetical protein
VEWNIPCPERVTETTASIKKLTQSSAADRPSKPHKYTSLNLFIPLKENKGIILLLQISEAQAAHGTVLSQSPDIKAAIICACDNATAIYDLMTVALIQWGHANHLHKSFE